MRTIELSVSPTRIVGLRPARLPLFALGHRLSVSPTRIVGLRHPRYPHPQESRQAFSIPYSDRWVEAVQALARAVRALALSVSPTRIVGLRREAVNVATAATLPFSIPYSDRWVEAEPIERLPDDDPQTFSIPYSDRWVEASVAALLRFLEYVCFQYPLLGSLG